MCFYEYLMFKVQTNEEPVSENKVIFNIPDADNINHIVVFMTGQIPFPDGFGGAGKLCTVTFICFYWWKFLPGPIKPYWKQGSYLLLYVCSW